MHPVNVTGDADGAMTHPVLIELAMSTTVTVDGTTVADPEPTFPGPPLPAVTLRMPGFLAHTLAHALADWTRVCELLEVGERIGWWVQAQALHDAARATGAAEACACPAGDGVAARLGAGPDR